MAVIQVEKSGPGAGRFFKLMARFGLSSGRTGLSPEKRVTWETGDPIVDPELDALAFKAFYSLQAGGGISYGGNPPYYYVDVLAEAQVLTEYFPLMRLLIEMSHSSAGGYAMSFSPHHRRAETAIFACESLGWYWLNELDKRIVEAGTYPTRTRECERCRIRIAGHPDASPRLWNAMVSRGDRSEQLIDTIRAAWSEFELDGDTEFPRNDECELETVVRELVRDGDITLRTSVPADTVSLVLSCGSEWGGAE
jgi:hypothetical protein